MASKLRSLNVFDLLCDDDEGDDVTVLSERVKSKAVVEVPSSPPRNRNHHIVQFNKEEIAAEKERRLELQRVMAADDEGINKNKVAASSNGNGYVVAKTVAKDGASNGETTEDGWKQVSKKVYVQRYYDRYNNGYRRRNWMNRRGGGGGAQGDRPMNGNAVSENGDGERGYRNGNGNGNGSYRGDRKRGGFGGRGGGNGRVEYQKVSEAEAKESEAANGEAVEIAPAGGENGDDASQVTPNSEGDASVAASEAAKPEETAEKKRNPEEEKRRKEWEERQRKRREEAEAEAKLMTYAQYQQVLAEKKREAEKVAKKASDAKKKVAERLVKDKELENMKLIGKKMVEVDDHKQKKPEKELKKPGSSDQKGRKGKVVDLSDAYKNVRGRDRRGRDRTFEQGPKRAATVRGPAGIPTDVELLNRVFPKLGEAPPPEPAPDTSAAVDERSATAAAKSGARSSAPAGAKSSAPAGAKSSAPGATKSSAPAAVRSGSHAKNGARPFAGSQTAKFTRPAAK